MRFLARLVVFAIIGLTAAKSGLFGFYYGDQTGKEMMGWMFGGFLLAVDLFRGFLAESLRRAYETKNWPAATAGTYLMVILVAWGLVTSIGIGAMIRFEGTDHRIAQQTHSSNLKQAIDELKRDTVNEPRSKAVVESELAKLLATEVRGRTVAQGVGDCSLINGPVSRTYCPQISVLRAEIADREQWESKREQLQRLQGQQVQTKTPVSTVDPQAKVFTWLLNADLTTVQIVMIIGMALLIESIAGFGLLATSERQKVVDPNEKLLYALQELRKEIAEPKALPVSEAPTLLASETVSPEEPKEPPAKTRKPRTPTIKVVSPDNGKSKHPLMLTPANVNSRPRGRPRLN